MQVKFGALVAEARGSLGGVVASRNRSGSYLRNRTTPINPKTTRQSEARAIMSSVSSQWLANLSTAQRDAWSVFASNMPTTNSVGEVIYLSGFTQFIKSNNVLANAGLAAVEDAPVIFNLPGEDTVFSATLDAGTGKVSVTFDDTLDWVDQDGGGMVIQVGIPVNASVNFFDGPWRNAGAISGDSVAAPTSPDATLDIPFAVADGQKVFVRAKIVEADGRVSDWFLVNSIVATA